MIDYPHLEKLPERIKDKFSVVLGDAFHFVDRMKILTNHYCKKTMFFVITRRFFLLGSGYAGKSNKNKN